jgi:hypothetical protein
MAVSKQWQEGPVTVTLQASGGTASLSANASFSAGGGPVAGFLSLSNQTTIAVKDQVLVDAGLAVAAEKFPALAGEIKALQALVDAELAKI